MNFALNLFLLVGLLGCQETAEVQMDPVSIPSPKPLPAPQVDESFMNPSAVEAWRSEITTLIAHRAGAVDPNLLFSYSTSFLVQGGKPDPLIGNPDIWNANYEVSFEFEPEVTLPSLDEAKQLELADDEWEAAQIFIIHDKMVDAARCAVKLEEESQWKVVAMIAVHTGDFEMLDRATTQMVNANWTTKTVDVIRYAIEQGKPEAARRIAKTHGWELKNVIDSQLVRMMAKSGDQTELEVLIKQELDDSQLEEVVADIVMLSKSKPDIARAYASRLLRLPEANLFIWTECREGCYSSAVRGSIELFQFVKSDPELKALYLQHQKQVFADMFPANETQKSVTAGVDPSSYVGFGSDIWGMDGEYSSNNFLYTHLVHVRAMRDAELTATWTSILDGLAKKKGFQGQSLAFEVQFGRYVLGLPFTADDPNLDGSEKIALGTLKGVPAPDMSGVWTMWNTMPPTSEELSQMSWLYQFLTRGTISSQRDAQIRTELGIESVPGEDVPLNKELQTRFFQSLMARYEFGWDLTSAFDRAFRAHATNVTAQRLRRERGLPEINLYPDSQEELVELMAPSLMLLEQKLPALYVQWRQKHPVPIPTP
ncbi:hypothetical protein HQ487_01355 [Candidatus Uhrbacteria bacterium]|nr:hypothetical protein [Candidatus Uhrbacteria bacterium]